MHRLRDAWRAWVIAILLAVTPIVSAASWSPEELMKAFARVKQHRVSFTETRYLSALKAPLVTSGTLVYEAPDRLEKRVTAPFHETTLIDGERVTVDNKTQSFKRSLNIKTSPALWAFVESFRATLAGDMTTLERFYKLRLEGSRQQWQLTLLPRDLDIAGLIRSIVIEGNNAQIMRVTTKEADGDHSILTLAEPAS